MACLISQSGMARVLAALALRQKRLFGSHRHHWALTPGTLPRDVGLVVVEIVRRMNVDQ